MPQKNSCSDIGLSKSVIMKNILLFIIPIVLFAGISSCGPHKYGISRDVNPKEDVHVFLDSKIIISGFTRDGKIKTVDQINNERTFFDFFVQAGEQEVYLKTVYTKGIYSFMSQSVSAVIKAEKGDIVFVCADIKEIGSRYPTGGNVDVLLTPIILYLKTEDEKGQAMIKNRLSKEYFHERCVAAIYSKP